MHGSMQNVAPVINQAHRGGMLRLAFLSAVVRVKSDDAGWTTVSDAQIAAVKRALASLKARGRVFSFHRGSNGRRLWTGERFGLYVTIREMQRQMMVIGTTDGTAAATAHAHRMLPLIERARDLVRRARNLGIDVDKPWPRAAAA